MNIIRRVVEILLVQDDPGDVRSTLDALAEAKVRSNLTWVPDGHQALAYLRHQNPYMDARRPDLILFDVNLRGKPDQAMLRKIKADADLLRIPVAIVTNSALERDAFWTYPA